MKRVLRLLTSALLLSAVIFSCFACSLGATVDFTSVHRVNAPETVLADCSCYSETVYTYENGTESEIQRIIRRLDSDGNVEICDYVSGTAYVMSGGSVYTFTGEIPKPDGIIAMLTQTYDGMLEEYCSTMHPLDLSGLRQSNSKRDGELQTVYYYSELSPQQISALGVYGAKSGDSVFAEYTLSDSRITGIVYSLGTKDDNTAVIYRKFDYEDVSAPLIDAANELTDTVSVTVLTGYGSTSEYRTVITVPRGLNIYPDSGTLCSDAELTVPFTGPVNDNMILYR